MAGNFLKYAGPLTTGNLPVDAHELIALCAPRPVFISGGALNGDGWADSTGMFSHNGARPVYRLLGEKNLGTTALPPIETPLIAGDLAFREHPGGHTPGPGIGPPSWILPAAICTGDHDAWELKITMAGSFARCGTITPPDAYPETRTKENQP